MDKWKEIWMTITKNKSRSVLTAFGVFWGIFMLMIMIGLGNALKNGIYSQISGFATNSCILMSDATSEPYMGFRKGRYWNIVNEDIDIIRERVPDVDLVIPVLFGNRADDNVVYGDRAETYNVRGQTPDYIKMESVRMKCGRHINDIDILEKRKVCVIGQSVYDALFTPGEDPLGKYIRVNGIYFRVVGVCSAGSSGVNINGRPDETVILPITTMQQAYNMGDKVHMLAITTAPDIVVKQVEEQVKDVLKRQHQISPTDASAVMSMNLEEQFNMFKYLGIGISALIWIVGLGTLMAGAVGVSNIMLVTIRERTKEIGIRRAIGASPRNIAMQIISESIVLTTLAGLLGIVLGVFAIQGIGLMMESSKDMILKNPEIAFTTAVGALVIIVLIGALAGMMPAARALAIKPIEALNEE